MQSRKSSDYVEASHRETTRSRQGEGHRSSEASDSEVGDPISFNPSSVAQQYSTHTRHTSTAASGSTRPSDDDVFNLARHYHSAKPSRSTKTSSYALHGGFFAQKDQFNVDQSVNFMDHSRANYAPPARAKRVSERKSFVDIFLSSRKGGSISSADRRGGGINGSEAIDEDEDEDGDDKQNVPRIAAYFFIILSFSVAAAFLALSVPHLARAGTLSEEDAKERLSTVHAALVAKGLSQPVDLQNTESSQFHALQWLTRTDPARLEPNDRRLPSRYALAVVFYSMHPEIAANHSTGQRHLFPFEWDRQDRWMTRSDVCYWYGITCDNVNEKNGRKKDVVGWNMTDNNLRGSIPTEIRALTNLVSIDLSTNQLTGPIHEDMFGLSFLKVLNLRDNLLTGTISSQIGSLNNAKQIDLSRNKLRGTIPNSIKTAVNLQQLALASNDLKGTIPEMTGLTLLTSLNLNANELVGKFPESLTALPRLIHMSIDDNNLSGTLPAAIGKWSSLETLSLGHNRFEGGIPDMAGLQNLTVLRLQKNLLQHQLPASLGALKYLERIVLDSNRLVGSIPPEWVALTQLEALIIHANQLTGTISTGIGSFVRLRDLWLNRNRFGGNLPTHLGLLTALNTLYLQENLFKGTVPTELGSLQDLQALRLAQNELVGVVPNEVCALKGKDELVFVSASCKYLKCICCDKCI